MLEEGQGDGVSRFSDDILFLISVFDDSSCASSQLASRPRSKKAVPTLDTVSDDVIEMLELWEENQDEAAISAEEELSEMLAEETEKAKHLRRRRMAAVGPY